MRLGKLPLLSTGYLAEGVHQRQGQKGQCEYENGNGGKMRGAGSALAGVRARALCFQKREIVRGGFSGFTNCIVCRAGCAAQLMVGFCAPGRMKVTHSQSGR